MTFWTEKYRPTRVDEYVFNSSEHEQFIRNVLKTGELPHLLLTGHQGTGKTSLVKVLLEELDVDPADILKINASKDNGVDYIRDTVTSFTESSPFGKFKVIHLEEGDYLSTQAQGTLRVPIEETAEYCRFIITCNYGQKIIPALRSRLHQLTFNALSQDELFLRGAEILTRENVEFDPETLLGYATAVGSDLRKMIDTLQRNSGGGKLATVKEVAESGDKLFKIIDLINTSDVLKLRKYVCENVTSEQFPEVYNLVYKNLRKLRCVTDDTKYEKALIILNTYQYQHVSVALPDINFAAFCAELQFL